MVNGLWAGLSGKRSYYFGSPVLQICLAVLLLFAIGFWPDALRPQIHPTLAISIVGWALVLAVVLKLWFAVDTLEYLRRGGRIGGAQAWLGAALRIKPILTVESEITPIERVRTSRRAFERLVGLFETCHEQGIDGWVVQHIQAPEQAAALEMRGRAIFGTDPVLVSEIGPVIGTHVGPGLLGAGGIPRSLL